MYGIVLVGIMGEFIMLSIDENVKVIKKIVEFVDGCIFIIVGIGLNVISEVVIMMKLFVNSGVVGCLSVVFYYNKLI